VLKKATNPSANWPTRPRRPRKNSESPPRWARRSSGSRRTRTRSDQRQTVSRVTSVHLVLGISPAQAWAAPHRAGIIDRMSLTISTLTRRAFPAVLVAASALNPAVAEAVPAGATGGTVVPLRSILRACDFSPLPGGASQSRAAASAIIRATGGTVTAEVHLAEPGAPGAHYNVSLIQAPRASSAPCTSPGPGVAVGSLDSDGVGQATTTVQDSIRPGTTGVWVFIQQPNPYSQSPAEVYTSDFVAPV
jgi:hypothetical protein